MFWSTRAFTRELDVLFSELREQNELLHEIDQLILTSDEAIGSKLSLASQHFARLLKARGWAIIFPDRTRLLATFGDDRYLADRKTQFLTQIRKKFPQLNQQLGLSPTVTTGAAVVIEPVIDEIVLSDDEDGIATILLIPVRGDRTEPEPFCYLAFTIIGLPRTLTGLETEEVREFAIKVATQLNILIQRTQDAEIARFKLALDEVYFQTESGLRDALSAAMDKAVRLLPEWGPFKTEQLPIVQLLSLGSLDKPLQIVAANNKKNGTALWESLIGKPVPIDNSICGYYLTKIFPSQARKGAWVTNPSSEHSTLFKSFQGTSIPESEMVVPLLHDGEPIGLLNFEHSAANVFSRYHVNMAEKVAAALVPFLTQTHQLETRIRYRELGLLQTVDNLIKRIKELAEHTTKGHLGAVAEGIKQIKRRYPEDKILHSALDKLRADSKEVDNELVSFIVSIPDYFHSGDVDLQLYLRKAINYFKPSTQHLGEQKDSYCVDQDGVTTTIEITWPSSGGAVRVFASPLIQEHLRSLLDNALQAIAERKAKQRGSFMGMIAIDVALHSLTDDLKRSIPGHRVAISIIDNGNGLPPEIIEEGFKYGKTSKHGGTGYGVASTLDYVQQYGGEIKGDNRSDGPGCKITISLDEFDPKRHTEASVVGF